MSSQMLVDATDLARWADRRDAQGRLPQVLRRLVLATVERVVKIDFRAHEGVQLGGWDGVTVAEEGNTFVPDGLSGWELSARRYVRGKADEDYESRSVNPLGVNSSGAAFVFVTPRRWGSKADWVAVRNGEGIWREVRAYDADDLETWLELAPAVHIWLSTLLGKYPKGVTDLETFWTDWSEATKPPMSAELILAGRQEETERIHQWLRGEPSPISLWAESREEALAFFAASLERLPPEERLFWFSRGVVVRDVAAWQRLVVSDNALILVPVFDGSDVIARGVRGGHRVLIPLGRDASPSPAAVRVSRLSRDRAKEALVQMGFSEERAGDLATSARRSLTALRRKLAISPEVQCPEWAKPSEARAILPVMLVGTWNDASEGDRDVVAALAKMPYTEISDNLVRWANESDPPVRRVGNTWILVSKEDSWSLLARFITREDLENFESVALDVLGTPDPRFDLPSDEQWRAGVLGLSLPHSDLLREGLADTLALMGARSESTTFADGSSGQERVNRIVRQLLHRANEGWRVWASISPVLPLLAEAAPGVFLAAVEEGLSGEQPVLLNLFTDSDHTLFASSPHTGLLWALEVLAWSPEHLGHTSLLLAKLARLDPGGKLGNRPRNSLREIYVTWHPQTAANLDRRLRVLDAIRSREPDVAWWLLRKLTPSHHDTATRTQPPRWREWVPDPRPRVTYAEFGRAVSEMAVWLLEDVGSDGRRWQDLIQLVNALPGLQQDAFIERLLNIDVEGFDIEARVAVWNALRGLISEHRRHSDADWALSKEQVDRLECAYERFEPDDLFAKSSWLFSDGALWNFEGEDLWSKERALEKARLEAVQAIYDQGGLAQLLDMAARIDRPTELGVTLGQSELLAEQEDEFIGQELNSPNSARSQLVRGFVAGRFRNNSWAWAREKLCSEAASDWSSEQRVEFLTYLPFEGRTWDLVDILEAETQRLYWQQVGPHYLPDPDQCERAAESFVEHGCPYAAIDVLACGVREKQKSKPSPHIIVAALERAVRTDPGTDIDWSFFSYKVGELLDCLEASGEVEEGRIAALEWALLPLFRYRERRPKILHRELARNPDFFAEVVALVYKAEDEPDREMSEEAHTRARHGHELLESWQTVPGRWEDGSIDPEALKAWVGRAREVTDTQGRGSIGEYLIGRVLSFGPADPDETWPSVAVRDLIEEMGSQDIEDGFRLGIYNSRGFVSRGLTEGGGQEKQLAEKYLNYAGMIGDQWPRTAAMLRMLADTYLSKARREDLEAELREDLWH
jgi:hypothetical protein